jgi:lipopolysaccharide export system protein LptA
MTSPIINKPSPFNRTWLFLALLALSFSAVEARADDTKAASKQVTRKNPVSISSSQLTFDKLKGLTLFKGKVKALHGTVVLTADEIRAFSDDNVATAKGHVRVVDKTQSVTLTCGNLEYQNMMEVMTAHDHPMLVSVDNNKKPVTILGRQMVIDSENKTFVVNQNVEIHQGETNVEAQKATFFGNDNKLILENDPRVYTSSAEISARRITTNLGEDKSFFAEGLADALFNPNGEPLPITKKDDKGQDTTEKKGKTGSGKANNPALSGTSGIQPSILATPGAAQDLSKVPTAVPSPVSSSQ